MKKRYFLLVMAGLAGALGSATGAHAQAAFQPGYVVPLAGDTLRGQVQELGTLRSTRSCRFRPTATAAATDYAPTALRGYGLAGGARYETRLVPASDSAQTPATPLFVELLVNGPARFYTCRDRPGRTRYFVAVGPPDARLRELAERRVKVFANGLDAYQTRALYRDTLATALRACPAVQVLLPKLPFQQTALARAISRYNDCVGGSVSAGAVLPVRTRDRVVVSLIGGYQHGTMTFSSSATSAILNGSAASFFSLVSSLRQGGATGGVALGLPLPYTRRTLSLRLEAHYSHELYEGEFQGPVATTALPTTQYNTYRFDLHYGRVPLLLRYTLVRSRAFRPFVEAGGVYARVLSAQTAFTQRLNSGTAATLPFFANNIVQNNQFGLLGGVGASVPLIGERRLSGLVRVFTSTGPSDYTDVSSPIFYLSALLSFELNKP